MQRTFDLEAIELAFFNYDNDGSECSNGSWEKRCQEWKSFKQYLFENQVSEHDEEK